MRVAGFCFFDYLSFVPDMNESVVDLETNGSHTIELPGLGNCGYSWVWEADNDRIVRISHQYIVPENPKPGDRGIEQFTITGVKPGACVLSFKQIHSWEKDQPPLDARKIRVNVRKTTRS
jgi:predicted secreted protein